MITMKIDLNLEVIMDLKVTSFWLFNSFFSQLYACFNTYVVGIINIIGEERGLHISNTTLLKEIKFFLTLQSNPESIDCAYFHDRLVK